VAGSSRRETFQVTFYYVPRRNRIVSELGGRLEMKRIFLMSLFFIFTPAAGKAQSNNFVSIEPEPRNYAWWLRAEFQPFELQVRGIPVGKIRATWCKATEFRKDLFPSRPASDLERSALSFSIDGNFDGSKIKQTALIGVYETCSGKRGSFLLLLAQPPGKTPTIRFVHEMPEVQFGMLLALPDSTIQVFHCMECDHITSFKWDKSKGRFVRLPPREH
jgi:hypothetical protein